MLMLRAASMRQRHQGPGCRRAEVDVRASALPRGRKICGREKEATNGTPVSRAREAPRQIMASRETRQPARSSRRAATTTAITGDARAASAGADRHARRGPKAPACAKQNGSCIRAGGGARTGAHQTMRRVPSRSASDATPPHVHTFSRGRYAPMYEKASYCTPDERLDPDTIEYCSSTKYDIRIRNSSMLAASPARASSTALNPPNAALFSP